MKNIVVLTATYNHPKNLVELYNSLEKQSAKAFTWVIVDDGSAEETKDTVAQIMAEATVDVVYYRKMNGGKSSAINYGLDRCVNEAEFILIVDDDERLFEDAIGQVTAYVEKYRSSACGIIHFNRCDEKGNAISNATDTDDVTMSLQARKKNRIFSDGYVGYYAAKLREKRFPVFNGEKYVGPSVLMMLVGQTNDIVWTPVCIGQTEYLQDGITKQGRKLRVKNPKGMYVYCALMQQGDCGITNKVAYSIYAYAYLSYAKIQPEHVEAEYATIKEYPVTIIAKPLGAMLAAYWKRKFATG